MPREGICPASEGGRQQLWSAAGREHQNWVDYACGVGAGLIVEYGGCLASTTGTTTVT
jgi:hypothetical protein